MTRISESYPDLCESLASLLEALNDDEVRNSEGDATRRAKFGNATDHLRKSAFWLRQLVKDG